MKPGKLRLLSAALLSISVSGPLRAESAIEREFSFDPAQVRVVRADGALQVSIPGAMHEFRAGRPDLPWRSERIELPVGFRVRAVEVLSIDARPLAEGGRLASAIRPTPGLGKLERTEPDPAVFSHRGFLPDAAAELGAQGFQRGANVALLNLSPVRWDPASGRLEALTRIRVRIVLEPTDARPLARERVPLTVCPLSNVKLRVFDRVNKDNDPTGVTCQVGELIHPWGHGLAVAGDPLGSGQQNWSGVHGSSVILSMAASPGLSGLSPNGPTTSGQRHDWYVAISASPDSIGSKTAFGLYFELEYL